MLNLMVLNLVLILLIDLLFASEIPQQTDLVNLMI